ncbi:NAD(P)-dependent dehydrogenase (short-subunit alcohol dehydrogenase family) [Micromonospora luteifusca]|uniref:NAD(P)-dependent dehydrogenase (Short-subunit alcohol dehydrogenase family) n=1 Tax=Micromonospora luteifusca TaxID=709860 RepID=A0ABS2M0Y0_9ACTN|nr:SDR family NAD(P)-dependent oxidoreductase [Micromonospora luteifusca]MBM7493658.1 NAD(P)-dependent dehydrogenase (short-subunit alcohol dehydrogenase family) [Micromonospora luteifusca]
MVVIVGASSGVGRATAQAFVERGDRLVLAARATTTLAEVRAECADVDVLTVPPYMSAHVAGSTWCCEPVSPYCRGSTTCWSGR